MFFSIAFHILAVVIWVGGMFFAYNALRPAAAQILEPPLRLELWVHVFRRFFIWVWLSIFLLFGTGYWMLFNYFGGFTHAGTHIHLMHGGAIIMLMIFLHVFFAPYRRLKQAVSIQDYQLAAKNLNQIRKSVALNTTIGLLIIVIASVGKYL